MAAEGPPLPTGPHDLGLRYHPGDGGRVVLLVDGAEVGQAPLPGWLFFPNLTTAGAGLLVGRDRGFPVSSDYRPPFAFTGTIEQVELTAGDPAARPDPGTELRASLAAD